MASELGPGTVIGARYRLERLLGEGGMGAVWAAEDTAGGGRCALKLMKDPGGDPEARKRFLREGRAAAAVRHPNVVSILDVLEPEGEPPVIAMELLEGEPLRARLRQARRLPLDELAGIMVPVLSAVGAAHALGIVHRDLKPENIFLARGAGGERVVKVLDFGIAKLTALDGEAMRSTGITTAAVLGTPAYMAPEQVFAEKDLDHRADIWALGVILYECLAGVCPTEGDNVGQVLKHVVARPFEPLDRLVPELPAEIPALVARMLARERSERPADLHEVVAVLEPFAGAPAAPFGAPAAPPTTSSTSERASRPASTGAFAPTAAALRDTPRALAREPTADRLAETVSERPRKPPSPQLQPPPPPPRRARRLAALGGAALALAGSAAALAWWPAAPSSPLDPPDARIACPVLRAAGVEAPAGWLGAAAAAVACERARVLLGGRPERTLVPAELLDLSRDPGAAFPADPYGQADARDRSVDAARQRAQAYLDGEVTWSAAGFAVVLSLHRADGGELARSAGQGRGLYEAVRAAMGPLVGAGRIPKARALEPALAAWARTDDIDDALGVLDLTFAFSHNAGGLPEECGRFEALSARVRELGLEGRWNCAFILGRKPPEVELAALGPPDSEASRATRIRVALAIHQAKTPDDVAFVRELSRREQTPRGQSLLAATESCLSSSTDVQRDRAIAAVKLDPKNSEGGGCHPWDQLMTVMRDIRGADGPMRAMQAWEPWSSYAWFEPAFSTGGKDGAVLPLLRRAYVLSPLDTNIANTFANGLIASGDRVAARGVAADLRRGGLPVHDVAIELIRVRVDASEARFGAALEQARKASAISGEDDGWIRLQRFELAWHALELAVLLGRPREVADHLVERFIDPEPPPLDGNSPLVPVRFPAICARASAPDRCFARARALRPRYPGASTQDTDDLLTGAERYVKGDLDGAARAWRTLLGGDQLLASALPDAMADAFERTGAVDLAEQVDREVMKRARELNGATLGHVRAARRAADRGARDEAERLARQVIQAWAQADEEPPTLATMRELLAKLQGSASPPGSRP